MSNTTATDEEAVQRYNKSTGGYEPLCSMLAQLLTDNLTDSSYKLWHGAPVWFINGNPIAGYAVRKKGVQLLFWSGQSFNEPGLSPEGSFKAAQAYYATNEDVNIADLRRWLEKSITIQWDYKNIVKRRGELLLLDIEHSPNSDPIPTKNKKSTMK